MQVQEDEDNLLPFAKCSRVVNRSPPRSLLTQSLGRTPQRYGDVFWENLSQRPSPSWMDEHYVPPVLRAAGCSQPYLYPPGKLPPPEMLCRRKRRRLCSEGMQQGPGSVPAPVRAVIHHLDDLRRRQRTINELKAAQWGSAGAAAEPLVLCEEGCGLPGSADHPTVGEQRAPCPQEDSHLVASGGAQLLWSPWSPPGQDGARASGRLSPPAYSSVLARRNPGCRRRGTELEAEE